MMIPVGGWHIIRFCIALPFIAAAGFFFVTKYFPYSILDREEPRSLRITDRSGRDLRITTDEKSNRMERCSIDQMGPWIAEATIAIEDHRFFGHIGIDPIGIGRAIVDGVAAGRIVAGGSTITQQLARMLRPELMKISDWKRKPIEAWDAIRIEQKFSKDKILEEYLNRAPYGNRTIGIRAASELYFGKTPDRLTLAEAALLAGLPQAPTALSPYHHPSRAIRRQKIVLDRLLALGKIDAASHGRACGESIVFRAPSPEFRAPHFVSVLLDRTFGELPREGEMATTIDLSLQDEVEKLVVRHVERLSEKRATQAAAIVIDSRNGEILSWVGSTDFFGGSQVDGVLAPRQPGSTLKPFTYAIALERGKTPADLVANIPIDEADFSPQNFDRTYSGPVRIREALACSLNIPAVRILRDVVGVERLLNFLRRAGMKTLDRDAEHYGLALTLGAGEVRLLDLACAYAIFSRSGITVTPHALLGEHNDDVRILSRESCDQITSILSDDVSRRPAFGSRGPLSFSFPVAAKTGTSKDFRDNWAVGYTPRHVVAVWVGNFDGSSMVNCSGVTGAAPLMHEIMNRVGKHDGGFEQSPSLVALEICPFSGEKSGSNCPGRMKELFLAGHAPGTACSAHFGSAVTRLPEANTANTEWRLR